MTESHLLREAARLHTLYQYDILDTPSESVFDELVYLAAHVCDTPIALINFIDSNRQWVKASFGWMITELPQEFGFCMRTIYQSDLLIVPEACQDIRADNPFTETGLNASTKPPIRFYAGMPLITPNGQAIGTLCVMDQRSRDLDPKQIEMLKVLARQVGSHLESRLQLTRAVRSVAECHLTEQALKESKQQIQVSLEEKEILLKEIHHRVKNNLQIISSLLNLQSGYVKDQQALASFKESQSRIKSMALIHEKLYQSSEDSLQINFAEYVQQLVVNLFRVYGVDPATVALKVQVEDILLGVDTAIPCGLILNELVSNCLKHAFPPGRSGEVNVSLMRVPDQNNKLTLTVQDNGVGFPKHIDFSNSKSLGLQLVNTLAAQLKGDVKLYCNAITKFNIEFMLADLHRSR